MAIERKPTATKRTRKTVKKTAVQKNAATDKRSSTTGDEAGAAPKAAAKSTGKPTAKSRSRKKVVKKKTAAPTKRRDAPICKRTTPSDPDIQAGEDAVVIRFPPAGAPPFPSPPDVDVRSNTPAQSDAAAAVAPKSLPESYEPACKASQPAVVEATPHVENQERSCEAKPGRRRRTSRRRRPRESADRHEDARGDVNDRHADDDRSPARERKPDENADTEPSPPAESRTIAGDDHAGENRPDSPSRRRRARRKRSRTARASTSSDSSADDSSAKDSPADEAADQRPSDARPDAAPESVSNESVVKHADSASAPNEARESDERPARRRRGRRGGRRGRGRRSTSGDDAAASTATAGERESLDPAPSDAAASEPQTSGAAAEDDAERELAKLPAVKKEMIINAIPREECRIAVLDNGKLEEIHLERASSENHVGSIYKGRITNVEPSIQAAFIDFGLSKNGFLHISDVHPEYFPSGGPESERVGRKTPRRDRPPIQRCLRRGQEILVQIIKEGIGTKGPTLTTYLSIPGRFLVMLPGMERSGVSRKIEDGDNREKLHKQMSELELPENMGFIARTAALGHTKRELQTDLNYLLRLWKMVEKRIKSEKAPAEMYRESDLVIRTIRDVFSSDIERILVDDEEVAERAREFLAILSPRARDTVAIYRSKVPIFHRFGIEAELERLHSRHVPLKLGGSLVFDSTEALVAVDVNSGSFREHDDAEETAYKINLEAAVEIARQLRLRDLGGVIVCDFIDMRFDKHKRAIERTLARELKAHKERAKVLRMSGFGLIEMTRQRQRASLMRSVYQDCQHCHGTGLAKTAESVALDVMRLIQLAVTRDHIAAIEVNVSSEVARLLQNRKRGILHRMETEHRRSIVILADPSYGLDQLKIQYFDQRGRAVPIN